jgi:hypothetical protein
MLNKLRKVQRSVGFLIAALAILFAINAYAHHDTMSGMTGLTAAAVGVVYGTTAQWLIIANPTTSAATAFGYPGNSQVVQFENTNGNVHLIWGTDASPATNHGNAPNGSLYIYLNSSGYKLWYKGASAADVTNSTQFGSNAGAWVGVTCS